MKTYEQLTEPQKKLALEKATELLLDDIVSGAMCFDDKKNGGNLQERIDKALGKSEAMQTPWFASEYIIEAAKDEVEGMAHAIAEMAKYPEPYEHMIDGIA